MPLDLDKLRTWGRAAGRVMTVAHVADVGASATVLVADLATRPDQYRKDGQFARNLYRAWMDDDCDCEDGCEDCTVYCDGCDDDDCPVCAPLEEHVPEDDPPEAPCGHCGWVHQDDDPCIIDLSRDDPVDDDDQDAPWTPFDWSA